MTDATLATTGGQSVVVVGVDASTASLHALTEACKVVRVVGGSIVVVLAHHLPLLGGDPESDLALVATVEVSEEFARDVEAETLAVCLAAGVPATFVRREGDPARSIIDVAHETDARCIVVGSTIHGAIAGVLVSSVAEHLLHHSDRSLVIVRPRSNGDDGSA